MGTLDSFNIILVFVVLASEPVAVTTWLLSVVLLARSHPSPRGMAGGAPSAARAAALPAAMAAANGISAGASDSNGTGTHASEWETADFGRRFMTLARGMPLAPSSTMRPPQGAPKVPRKCEARLAALLAAVGNW